ncbi:MAG: HIT domain-containing protein, partial [bacterium]|nr:HIT domain-containing protein [bacterium]
MPKEKANNHSELRQDLTSREWVLFPPSKRTKRPAQFAKDAPPIKKQPKRGCAFENPKEAGGGVLIASYPDTKAWRLQVVPNKFPVMQSSKNKAAIKKRGVFQYIEGYGHHELVITRGHDANFPKLSISDANLLFNAFRERYREIAKDKNTAYISIYHNWGPHSGASIYHPHYQILSTPVLPPMAERSLDNARRHRNQQKECVHCLQVRLALADKRRLIYEDELSVAFAPYAPKEPFEFRVSPKNHTSYFEDASEYEINSMVKSLQTAIKKLDKRVKHANYNFYLHTSP